MSLTTDSMAAAAFEESPDSVFAEELQVATRLRAVLKSRTNDRDKLEEQATTLEELGRLYIGRMHSYTESWATQEKRARYSLDQQLNNYTKASALFNAALRRSSSGAMRDTLLRDLHEVWSSFLTSVEAKSSVPNYIEFNQRRENNNLHLERIRREVALGCEELKLVWDRYESDTLDEEQKREIENKLISTSRSLGKLVSTEMNAFFRHLITDSIAILGDPPCRHAVIGMGSLARDEATPYSDLEFAILIPDQDESEAEAAKSYFRRLTHLFHLIVLDFGETILPAMAIHSLNDFYGTLEGANWFYDDVTPSGLKFDGAMPWACKTPLGRKREGRITKQELELICSPRQMVNFITEESCLKEGYHLADVLSCTICLHGDTTLWEEFEIMCSDTLAKQNENYKRNKIDSLKAELITNVSVFLWDTSGQINKAKHQFYRFPSVAVNHLRSIYQLKGKSPWQVLDEMESRNIFSCEGARNIRFLSSVVFGIRIFTYMSLKAQKENVSILPFYSPESEMQKVDTPASECHITNRNVVVRYFLILHGFSQYLSRDFLSMDTVDGSSDIAEDFIDQSPESRGNVLEKFGMYQESISIQHSGLMEKLRNANASVLMSKYNLSDDHYNLGKSHLQNRTFETALKHFGNALEIMKNKVPGAISAEVVSVLISIAEANTQIGCFETAMDHVNQALSLAQAIHGDDGTSFDTVEALCIKGEIYFRTARYYLALSFFEESLLKSDQLEDNAVLVRKVDITLLIAATYSYMKNYVKALEYCDKCLSTVKTTYGMNTNHPDIAEVIMHRGSTFMALRRTEEAYSCFKEAKEMYTQFYQTENTIYVAHCLGNIAVYFNHHAKYQEAFDCQQKAYDIMMHHYTRQSENSDFVYSRVEMAHSKIKLGQLDSAMADLDGALEMAHRLFGENEDHPIFVTIAHYKGEAYSAMSDFHSAVAMYTDATQMYHRIYTDKVNVDFLELQQNLMTALLDLNEEQQVIEIGCRLFDIEVEYREKIPNSQPKMATIHCIAGNAYATMGDTGKSLIHLENSRKIMDECSDIAWKDRDFITYLLALSYHSMDYFDEGVSVVKSYRAAAEATYPINGLSHEMSLTLDTCGAIYVALEMPEQAEECFSTLVKLLRAYDGENDDRFKLVNTLFLLGQTQFYLEKYDEAKANLDESLKRGESIEVEQTRYDQVKGKTLLYSGLVLKPCAEYERAIDLFKQSLSVYHRYEGSDSIFIILELMNAHKNIGESYLELSEVDRALYHFLTLHRVTAGCLGKNDSLDQNVAANLGYIGICLFYRGDLNEALKVTLQAKVMLVGLYGDFPHDHVSSAADLLEDICNGFQTCHIATEVSLFWSTSPTKLSNVQKCGNHLTNICKWI